MDHQNRPPVNVRGMWEQVAQQNAISQTRTPLKSSSLESSMPDEAYARLMARCNGPQDDPERFDL